jgi:hypothetical protein
MTMDRTYTDSYEQLFRGETRLFHPAVEDSSLLKLLRDQIDVLTSELPLRADAKLFLLGNAIMMVALPIVTAGPEIDSQRLRKDLEADVAMLATRAVSAADDDHISARSVTISLATEWDALRTRVPGWWDPMRYGNPGAINPHSSPGHGPERPPESLDRSSS